MSDSSKFPTDFIPVSRPLAKELGYQVAYVFGVIWNYCQMEDGICKASHDSIADRAGMSRRTVIRHIEELIKHGYIEDLTPDLTNAPHHLCAKPGVSKLHSKEAVNCDKMTQQNENGMPKLHSGYAKMTQHAMPKLHTNRKNKKTESIDIASIEEKPKKPKQQTEKQLESQAMFKALAELCQYDLSLITNKERGKLNQTEKKLREGGRTPADLKSFEKWWYEHEWRGKLGQPPNTGQILETWGQFKNHQNGTNGRDSPPKPQFKIVAVKGANSE